MYALEDKAQKIYDTLDGIYTEAVCSLDWMTPFQLLIATQLAAQCTDERVNQVTPELFRRFPDPAAFAVADLHEIENAIRSTGFFRNKAKNIQGCSRMLLEIFNGVIPDTMENLLKLPGVGRKTANLMLSEVFGQPGMVVDTHAMRLSKRIGLTEHDDATKVEHDLRAILKPEQWGHMGHLFVYHGRAVCDARKPACERCQIRDLCNFGSGR